MNDKNLRNIALDRARQSGVDLTNNQLNVIIRILTEKEKEIGVLSYSYLDQFFRALFIVENDNYGSLIA